MLPPSYDWYEFLIKWLGVREKHDIGLDTIPYRVPEGKRPHILLFMSTGWDAEDGKITANEVFELVLYILSEMIRQVFSRPSKEVKWPDDSELHLVFPVR